ncbi:hypothetical protein BKG96_02445 [Rodentibacter caecimuris]|uniref:Competence protein ComB n=1 Tax=Rodentibacter caecimuris TaxID=1796644 RepID=A0A1V3KNZ4_9PAST|nr:hypothetical protein [Rodentibacter heylii]OOF79371.1 hypothetical protein BKG96_02445 [Rodentibacter heylii]
MNGINLLPWRLEKYQRLLCLFIVKMFAVLIVGGALYAVLTAFQRQQQGELNTQQQFFIEQKKRLAQTVQQITEVKQTIRNLTELQEISPNRVEQVISLLPQLPLQQGELEALSFNEEGIRLNGFCVTKEEFETFREFLSQHFASFKLTQFQPEQGRWVFQFDLSPEVNEK